MFAMDSASSDVVYCVHWKQNVCLLCHSMFSTLSTLSCLGMAVRSESNSHKAQCVRISIWDDGRHVGLFFCTQIYQVNLFKSCIHRKSHCDLSVLYVQSMYANTYIYICIFCTFFYPKTVNCVNLCDCRYNFCTKNWGLKWKVVCHFKGF